MLHHDPAATKSRLFAELAELAGAEGDTASLVARTFAPGARCFGNHPINAISGVASIAECVWGPLRRSFRDLRRGDDIFTGGSFKDTDWISATGHLHGVFAADYHGIPATNNWASLRYGEFHQLEGGKIIRSHVIYDLPDLMRQAGLPCWRPGLGVETLTPGPATRDGVLLTAQDPRESRKSLDLVESMIFEGFLAGDYATDPAKAIKRYWTDDMMWYGPGLIGATMGFDAFMRLHEKPWDAAMHWRCEKPTRDNKHVTRFGDGKFCSFTGWPSTKATHGGPFLGLPATGRPVDIRIMDFYHRRGDRLSENWIFIDMPDLFLQLGVDLFARMAEERRDKTRV